MPPEGLDAARVIRAEFPDIAILVLSAHAVVEHAVDLLTSGERSGYLLKSRVTDVDDFIETLKRIVRGGSVVDPVLVAELVAARSVGDPLDVWVQGWLPERAEVAAYFVLSEALANVAKHARTSVVEVQVEVRDGVDQRRWHRRSRSVARFRAHPAAAR